MHIRVTHKRMKKQPPKQLGPWPCTHKKTSWETEDTFVDGVLVESEVMEVCEACWKVLDRHENPNPSEDV